MYSRLTPPKHGQLYKKKEEERAGKVKQQKTTKSSSAGRSFSMEREAFARGICALSGLSPQSRLHLAGC